MSNDGTGLRERLYAESENYGLHEDVRRLLREAHDELEALSAVAPPPVLEGWVLVPREPTPRMIDAFHAAGGLHGYHAAVKGGLRSAIATAASPAAPAQPEMQAAPVAWQPIESAPKDGTPILVWFDVPGLGVMRVTWEDPYGNDGESAIWCVDDNKHGPYPLRGYRDGDEKGWMPLPASNAAASAADAQAAEGAK